MTELLRNNGCFFYYFGVIRIQLSGNSYGSCQHLKRVKLTGNKNDRQLLLSGMKRRQLYQLLTTLPHELLLYQPLTTPFLLRTYELLAALFPHTSGSYLLSDTPSPLLPRSYLSLATQSPIPPRRYQPLTTPFFLPLLLRTYELSDTPSPYCRNVSIVNYSVSYTTEKLSTVSCSFLVCHPDIINLTSCMFTYMYEVLNFICRAIDYQLIKTIYILLYGLTFYYIYLHNIC